MLWFLLALLALYAAFLQAALQVDVHSFDTSRLKLRLDFAGFHKTWQYHLTQTPQGHQLRRTDSHGSLDVDPTRLRQSKVSLFAALLRRADRARKFLLAHLHLEHLDALLLLRTGDAARSALLCGAAQGVISCIPAARREMVRIRVLPEFFRPHSTIEATCIIRFRLGTIILTAGMLLLAYLREQRLTESEAMQYGTSHR